MKNRPTAAKREGLFENLTEYIMTEILASGKSHPCPICGRTKDSDCRILDGGNRVFCHTYSDKADPINGFKFFGQSDKAQGFGHWGRENPQKIASEIRSRVEYFYDDRNGNRLIKVDRVPGKAGGKDFYQSYWLNSEWVTAGKVPQHTKKKMRASVPIYRYTEVRKSVEAGQPIIVVEGERSADFLRSKGFNATTTVGGCKGYTNWGDYSDDFAGARVLVCPDMDIPGQKYASAVKRDVPVAEDVFCFPNSPYWKDLPANDGLDIVDWFASGATNEDFERLINRAIAASKKLPADALLDEVLDQLDLHLSQFKDQSEVEWEANKFAYNQGLTRRRLTGADLVRLSQARIDGKGTIEVLDSQEILERNIEGRQWLIAANIPLGSTIVLASKGGLGKTTLLYGIAKAVSQGKPWSDYRTRKAKVLIIQADEPECDVQEKLEMAGYHELDRGQVDFVLSWRFTQTRQLEELIQERGYQLIIIDSWTAANSGTGIDTIASSAGDGLYKLRNIAQRRNCTFMVVHHFNKMNDLRDSSSINDNVSEVWKLYPPREEEDLPKDQYYLERSKSRSGIRGKYLIEQQWATYSWLFLGPADGQREIIDDKARTMLNWLSSNPGEHEITDIIPRCNAIYPDAMQRALDTLRRFGFCDSKTFFRGDEKVRTYSLPTDSASQIEQEVEW